MKSMLHHSTKYDGSLHYRYRITPVARSSTSLVAYRGIGVAQETYRGDFASDFHALHFYFSDAYFNIVVAWERDWIPRMHYVNIATPATWDDEEVRAVDLDLDLIVRATERLVIVDDEDEFEAHTERFSYPPELVRLCRSETKRLHRLMVEGSGIFGTSIFGWRPGLPLDGFYLCTP